MVSRGTEGPSPQTETFHRPTGKEENSQEENIKSEIHTERERAKAVPKSERQRLTTSWRSAGAETSHMCSQNVFIMTGIGMMPQWGLLASFYIQEIPRQLSHMAAIQSSLVQGNRCCFKISFRFCLVGPDGVKLHVLRWCTVEGSTQQPKSQHKRSYSFSLSTSCWLSPRWILEYLDFLFFGGFSVLWTEFLSGKLQDGQPLQCLISKESCWWAETSEWHIWASWVIEHM